MHEKIRIFLCKNGLWTGSFFLPNFSAWRVVEVINIRATPVTQQKETYIGVSIVMAIHFIARNVCYHPTQKMHCTELRYYILISLSAIQLFKIISYFHIFLRSGKMMDTSSNQASRILASGFNLDILPVNLVCVQFHHRIRASWLSIPMEFTWFHWIFAAAMHRRRNVFSCSDLAGILQLLVSLEQQLLCRF
jgi:hypothetical protein